MGEEAERQETAATEAEGAMAKMGATPHNPVRAPREVTEPMAEEEATEEMVAMLARVATFELE
jgi:hypothetical protein